MFQLKQKLKKFMIMPGLQQKNLLNLNDNFFNIL